MEMERDLSSWVVTIATSWCCSSSLRVGDDGGGGTKLVAQIPVLVTAALLSAVLYLLLWRRRNGGGRLLPPGSRGLPVIGETLEMIRCYKTENPEPFVDERLRKHGSRVFTTHLFGETTVFSADPEVNKRVVQGEGRVVESSYPSSLSTLLGKHSLVATKGQLHKRLHTLTLSAFANPSHLRHHHLPEIDLVVRRNLRSWRDGQLLHLLDQTKKITFELTVKQLMSCESGEWTEELRRHYHSVVDGFFSLPIPFPFSTFSKALKARKKISELLRPVVRQRQAEAILKRANQDVGQGDEKRLVGGKDVLTMLLEGGDVKGEEGVVDFLLSLLVAGYETSPTVMALIVKFLSETPRALSLVKEEHEAIRASKSPSDPLEWSDYKTSMPFTQCVINETLRMANIVSGVFRRTTTDLDIKGYTIPKGFKVFSSFRAVHLDPMYYEDARTFNPWRWQQQPEAKSSCSQQQQPTNIFTPFGGGSRLCPGYELARLEISAFLHYLVTTFRWEATVKDVVVNFPTSRMVKGYPIRVHRLLDAS